MTIRSDIQSLAPGALVELFDLDVFGTHLYFHNGVNALGGDVVWAGVTYTRRNIEVTGFEWRSTGTIPRPTARIANLDGAFSQIVRSYDDLVGAKVTRHRTLVRYLDAINFPGGSNPTADSAAHFPDEMYYVARKSSENPIFIEFELAAAFDIMGVKLPRRQIVQNVCPSGYRSAECGFAGGAVAKANDTPTAILGEDVCGKRLSSCKLRFGENAELPYGGFPSAGLLR